MFVTSVLVSISFQSNIAHPRIRAMSWLSVQCTCTLSPFFKYYGINTICYGLYNVLMFSMHVVYSIEGVVKWASNQGGVGNVTDVEQREYDKACSRLPLSMKHLHALMCHAMYTQQRLYRNVLCM